MVLWKTIDIPVEPFQLEQFYQYQGMQKLSHKVYSSLHEFDCLHPKFAATCKLKIKENGNNLAFKIIKETYF